MSLIIIDKDKLDKLTAQLTVKLVILSMRTRTAKERLNTILDNLEPALETLKEITEKKIYVVCSEDTYGDATIDTWEIEPFLKALKDDTYKSDYVIEPVINYFYYTDRDKAYKSFHDFQKKLEDKEK
jgi:hypothetical protein